MKPRANGTIYNAKTFSEEPTCGSAQMKQKNEKIFFNYACVMPKKPTF